MSVRWLVAAFSAPLALALAVAQEEAPVGPVAPGVEEVVRVEGAAAWPREFKGEKGGRALLYQPQIVSWDEFAVLRARLAAALTLPGEDEPILGTIELAGDTATDLDERLVGISGIRIDALSFPSLDQQTSGNLRSILESLLPEEGLTVSVDRVVANLERGKVELARQPINVEPPPIFVSTQPAILLQFDGEPLMSPIEGTDLKYAVNTNWEYFFDSKASMFYLLWEDAWLKAPGRGGPWVAAGKLPKGFKKLPKSDPNFENARAHLKGRKLGPGEAPRVFVSERPAELIVIYGEPALERIEGTELLWVANSESDLFLSMGEQRYYYLVSGRWFRADSLDGPWAFATDTLPEDFALIPEDHARSYVLASVPGTADAQEAVVLAQVPQKATVDRQGLAVSVEYGGEPEFKEIEGTSLQYAVNTSYDVIRIGDVYYLCYQAVWFEGATPEGPWEVAVAVPEEIYQIPPSSAVYNTTYVQVYDYTPTTVTVGYSSGYWGVYVGWGCVMYGSGWYYSPYWYSYPHYPYYPVYYGYPYSYGVSAWYNPATGTYGRGASVYGPYGGMGYGAAYNPRTGTYARGAAAYGPYNARGFAEAYNPRTGTYARTRQGANVYGNWGTTGVRRGDDWVRSAHYSGDQGSVRGVRTSQGGGGFVGHGQEGLYAGRDGNVYRRSGDGWQKYGNGDWSKVQPPSRGDLAGTSSGRDLSGAKGIDRGTYDQLARDRSGRARGSTRARSSDNWQRGGGQWSGRGTASRGSMAGRARGRRR